MNKLISLSKKVDELKSTLTNYQDKVEWNKEISILQKIFEHNDLIKQEPKLWMFIRCDKKGNVLEEPKHFIEWLSEYNKGFIHEYDGQIMKQYQQALERVIFKDFKLESQSSAAVSVSNKNVEIIFFKDVNLVALYDDDLELEIRIRNLEGLTEYGLELK